MITEAILNSWLLGLIGMFIHFITKWGENWELKVLKTELLDASAAVVIMTGLLFAGKGSIAGLAENGFTNIEGFGIVSYGYLVKSQWRKFPKIFDNIVKKMFGNIMNTGKDV